MKTIRSFLPYALCFVTASLVFTACENRAGQSENEKKLIAQGETLFNNNCSSCHSFIANGIGPNLSGVTAQESDQWLREFIRDASSKITAGDVRAVQLHKQYNSIMPSFAHMDDESVDAIIAFLRTHEKDTVSAKTASLEGAITDPIAAKIPLSDLRLNLKEVAQIPASGKDRLRTRITKLHQDPATGRIYVLDLRGSLHIITQGSTKVYFDLKKNRPSFIDTPGMGSGFGSFAFHPEFLKNGLLYTTHTEPAGTATADFRYNDSIPVALQWVLTEWKTNNPGADTFTGTPREMMRVNFVSPIHGVQEIAFNHTAKPGDDDYGLLYIGAGDGGAVENGYPQVIIGSEFIFASVLRIDPSGRNSANGKYGIPSGNPFAGQQVKTKPVEVYAYGFRNPHRITWLTSGEMIVSNIGQRHLETVYRVRAGANHGWPTREGTFVINPYGDINYVFPLPEDDETYDYEYPVIQYDHDEGLAVAGGYEYLGSAVPSLKNKFVFADIAHGRIFMTDVPALKGNTPAPHVELRLSLDGEETTLLQILENKRADMRLGQGTDGELYVLTKPDGKIYKVVGGESSN